MSVVPSADQPRSKPLESSTDAMGPSRCRLVEGPLVPLGTSPRARRFRRRLAVAMAGLAVLGGIVLAHRPILAGIATWFRIDDPAPSDAIVLLLGGITHRPERVAELFREGIAPRVLVCTFERDHPLSPDETERTVARLETLGIPRRAIQVLPGEVESTFDEAKRVRDEVARSGERVLTVVTTAFHTRRAGWIFRKILAGLPVTVHTAAAYHPRFDEARWYRSDEGLVTYFTEALKLAYYHLVY